MVKVTTVNDNFKRDYPDIFNRVMELESYVRSDLRHRFDEADSAMAQIHIIDEARGLEIGADGMINDFCVNNAELWAIHEQANGRNLVEDESEKYFDFQQDRDRYFHDVEEFERTHPMPW